MVMCTLTVIIGGILIAVGMGGGVKIAGFQGMMIGGGLGAVVLLLGLFGVGC